jgi:hypothetical protein
MARMAANFAYEVSLSYLWVSLACRKIVQHGTDGFSPPAKEVILRIFVAIRTPSSSARSELAKLESNVKHANR